MPATVSSLPAAAQRSMAPHRAAGANDLFMPCADVKLVPMAPDDQCLYRSVIAALEDIGHHKSTFVRPAAECGTATARHRWRRAGQLSPRRHADERQGLPLLRRRENFTLNAYLHSSFYV